MKFQPTAVFDFDGVIHSYTSPWQGPAIIPDPPVPGIVDVLRQLHEKHWKNIIVSTRCQSYEGLMAIDYYCQKHGMSQYIDNIQADKPPAMVYIDDRGLTFDGNCDGLVEKIIKFKPWNKM